MLNINSRDNIYPGIEKFENIFPTFSVTTTFDIGMGQLVYDHNLGMPLENSFQIHLLELFTLVKYLLPWNNREAP